MKNEIKNAKKLLIVVDMINGFMKKGSLADPRMMRVVSDALKVIKYFKDQSYPIIAFRDVHDIDSPEHDDFKGLDKHCLRGSEEIELIDEVKIFEQDMLVVDKNATMGLSAPLDHLNIGVKNMFELYDQLEELIEVVFIGVCSDICVMNNAIPSKNHFNQFNRRVKVTVFKPAVDTYGIDGVHEKDEWNEMSFRFMRQAGINVEESCEIEEEVKYGK